MLAADILAQPNALLIAPFALLLALIALGPLLMSQWWHHHYPKVSFGLGGLTVAYYVFVLGAGGRVAHVAHEYLSFIALVGGLFVVAGGVHLKIKGEGTPWENVVFLFIGAILANVIGTTGASMLLIRPWMRVNRYRLTMHHVVFFIFIVSNVGGCLTPIGDPPLFIGFLKGVPFWWVLEHCWPMWLVAVGMLLGIFYVVDRRNFLKAPAATRALHATGADEWRVSGVGNIFFLALMLGAVFIEKPLLLREGIMIAAAAGSYFTTRKEVHLANEFNFGPVREVAILFVGIFATMMPALDWLQANSHALGKTSPAFFYWACGSLSSVLDNAPTYYSFLVAIFGGFVDPGVVQQVEAAIKAGALEHFVASGENASLVQNTVGALLRYHPGLAASGNVDKEQIEMAFLVGNPSFNLYLVAISLGAVFFGALTYIGNGPNFMVKAIAEQNKAHTPDFLTYIWRFALPFLLPVLVVVWFLFLR